MTLAAQRIALAPRRRRQPSEPARGPCGDGIRGPVREALVEREAKRRAGELLGVAHEDAALSEQPERADDRLLVARPVRQEAANQLGGGGKERDGLARHELAEDRAWLERFPAEDAHIGAELVAGDNRPQLLAQEASQRRLARQGAVAPPGAVIVHQRQQRRLQDRAIKPVLAAKMVIDRGLVDVGRRYDGADAGAVIAVARERP